MEDKNQLTHMVYAKCGQKVNNVLRRAIGLTKI